MTAYLALRHTSPPGLFPRLFAILTKWRLVTRYPHAGIVIDGVLYESTFKGGVHSGPFDPTGWDLFPLSVDPKLMLKRFESIKGSGYDLFGLLVFVVLLKFGKKRLFYCYELVHFMITGLTSNKRITSEILLKDLYEN